ncbi:2-dehydropantoate 2-reductase [Corynebacterium sp. YIM 101645]|uniref:2-dehydropantoate 2-reductase n=1 Tax=Corynebacterium lemuris TaxID=1859292 RepID=A0ABT2FWI3_9CORY|nr:2-dehydropantoate 2-reductase [Corynebacterium lemuris]MCS5478848.1 2-dehydropantoate 2-reductase [Corynebacterium lemuris]
MKIAVIGAGAVGGWFGGELVRAGHDVVFITRGRSLEILQKEGLRLNDDPPIPVRAVPELAGAGTPDVVLLAVKATTATDFAALLEGLGPQSLVAVTQNSVEVPTRVAEIAGTARTLPGVVRGYFHHTGPGRIEFHGGPISYDFGTWDGHTSEVVDGFAAALREAGVDARVHPDIFIDVWEKAMYVTSTGALGALAGRPLGELRTRLRPSLTALMSEIHATALANGVPLSDDAVERTLAFADRMPADATSSMHRDLAAGLPGSSHELDAQVGAICRLAARRGVDVRLHDLLLNVLDQRF